MSRKSVITSARAGEQNAELALRRAATAASNSGGGGMTLLVHGDSDFQIPTSAGSNVLLKLNNLTQSRTITLPSLSVPSRITIVDGTGWSGGINPIVAASAGGNLLFGDSQFASVAVPMSTNQIAEVVGDGLGNWWFVVPNPVAA